MSFKTILTVTGIEGGENDIKLAASLCEEAGAHLSLLVLGLAAPPPFGEYAAVVSDPWLEERRADMATLAERAAALSKRLAGSDISADIATQYREVAFADEAVGARARYTDLTVLGPELLSNEALRGKVIEGALFSSGRPALLVPEGAHPTLKPKRVMVAWDSSLEASRAVREALDMLVHADQVNLVLVDPLSSEDEQGAEPGADAATYLARHGAKDRGRSVAQPGQGHHESVA